MARDSAQADARYEVWQGLVSLARQYRKRFAIVALLAVLAACTDLLGPLIYRAAVNDIAGLFVGAPGQRGVDSLIELPDAADAPDDSASADNAREPQAHGSGRVSARTPDQTFRTLMWAVGLLFAVSVLSHWFSLAADQLTAVLASRIEADVIQSTFGHVLKLPLSFFNRRASGALAKQIDQLDQVAPIVTAAAKEVAPDLLRMIGVLAIMMTQSWKLTSVALLTLPPYLWIVRRSASRLETGLSQYYEMWDGVSSRIQDALGAIKTVKLSGSEQRETARLRTDSEAAYATYVERNRLANTYVFWQSTLNFLSRTLVLGYGGWLVLERQLTPGDVVMFVVYLDKLYSPVESLTNLGFSLQEHFASLRRAFRLLATGAEEQKGAPLNPGPGLVEIRDVDFGYNAKRRVLQKLNLTLLPHRVTALVGPSGAGKTTISDLLLRLFDADRGEVLIDGQAITSLDAASLRREIGVVAADGAIFRGSIADNIRYKRPDASDAEVLSAAVAAGLRQTLERLPEGLATSVGERGVGLSVGERQRLQIARALVGRPRILILDEATANLDYSTEREIRGTLLDRADRPTTLVIAHRYSMVQDADDVYVLDAGRVIEHGTPAQLLSAGGWFASFAASSQQHEMPENA